LLARLVILLDDDRGAVATEYLLTLILIAWVIVGA
jgi:Flp pilus assembly pilin Flp